MEISLPVMPLSLSLAARAKEGDEADIFLPCPATAHLWDALIPQLNRKFRLLDPQPWSSFTDIQRVGVLLGNPPPSS
jgi:hypothetical protein